MPVFIILRQRHCDGKCGIWTWWDEEGFIKERRPVVKNHSLGSHYAFMRLGPHNMFSDGEVAVHRLEGETTLFWIVLQACQKVLYSKHVVKTI